MLPIKSWRIFYADGSTFSSEDGTWADAPPFGVQVVVYYHVGDRKTLYREANDPSVYVYEGEDAVKMGLWMDTEGFYRVLDLARKSSEP